MFLMERKKKIPAPPRRAATARRADASVMGMVENIVGCKWSLTVLSLVRSGVHRPGAMEHAVEGLSAKVLNERLKKLVRFGILTKKSYAEIPPRVEYTLTAFGRKFSGLIEQIETLESDRVSR
jgi:DNA-binding HxlR family transcriptional regulator